MGLGSIIGAVATAAGAYGNAKNKKKTNDAYIQALKDAEDRKYAQAKAEYDAYNANQAAKAAAPAGGGGGGGSSKKKGDPRRDALKKSMKNYTANFGKQMDILNPFIQTGHQLLPQVSATYKSALTDLDNLSAYTNSPANMGLVQPVTQPNAGELPEWMKYKV